MPQDQVNHAYSTTNDQKITYTNLLLIFTLIIRHMTLSSAVLELARPLLSQGLDTPGSLSEVPIVTFRLLAKHNKMIRVFFIHHRGVVNVIAETLISGSWETRRSEVTLVRYITADPVSRHVLKQLGVIEHLVEIVEEGDLLLLHDVDC